MAESIIVLDGGQDFILISDTEPTTDAFVITSGGPQGETGPTGPRGFSILNGTGAPSSGTGVNGDFYLDTADVVLYGPKASGAWPGSGTDLTGKTILNGTGVPSSGLGDDGDIYLDVLHNLFYGPKTAGAWGSGQPFIGSVFVYVQPNEPVGAGIGSLWLDTDDPVENESAVPIGGGTGDVLAKLSPTTYDYDWVDLNLDAYDQKPPYDVAPTVPHAKDDEFDGSDLALKWTRGFKSTEIIVSRSWLNMRPNVTGFAHFIRQVAPTDSFTIMAKVSTPLGMTTTDLRPGIFMARTGNSKALVCGLGLSGGPAKAMWIEHSNYSEVADWGGYNGSWSSNQGGTYAGGPMWFKMTWINSGTINMYYSANGVSWYLFGTRTGWLQPDRIGIVMENNAGNTGTDEMFSVDWFRVTEP